MVIGGAWLLCEDGIVRPVLRDSALAADGQWIPLLFLVDVGADRTVFSEDIFRALKFEHLGGKQDLAGIGGKATSVTVTTKLRLTREDGTWIHVAGEYAAFTNPADLDMSVLGRDITNLFAVIVDRPQDVVCLVGGNHRYTIVDK
jgi:hypothetical protein